MNKNSFLKYESFLKTFLDDANSTHKFSPFVNSFGEILEESHKMSNEEADEILEDEDIPENIRLYIRRENGDSSNYKYKIVEKNLPLVNLIPLVSSSVNECEEWKSMNENDLEEFEQGLWESIFYYVTSEDLNEGFWSSIVKGVKAVGKAGKKAFQAAVSLIKGIGQFLKKAIQSGKVLIQKAVKWGVAQATKLVDAAKAKADKKFSDFKEKHSEQQIKQDSEDFKATVAWCCGKALKKGEGEGAEKAAQLAGKVIKSDQEGKEKAVKKLQQAAEAQKGGGKPNANPASNNENNNLFFGKWINETADSIEELKYASQEELFEIASAGLAMTIEANESHDQIDESLMKHFGEYDLSEGFFSKIKSFFGGGDSKKEQDKKNAQDDLMADQEKELLKKDKEKLKNAKEPVAPGGSPSNDFEKKMSKEEGKAESGVKTKGWIDWLKKIMKIAIQGVVFIVEWLLERGIRRGIKALSAICKKLGGPGVFLFIAVAALIAGAIGLCIELYFAVAHEQKGIMKVISNVVHGNVVGLVTHGLLDVVKMISKALFVKLEAVLKFVPVLIGSYYLFLHIKHVVHDIKMGKDVNHSDAINRERKMLKKLRVENEDTENEKIKEKISEIAELINKNIKFHEKQREQKIEIAKIAQELSDSKKEAKKAGDKNDNTKKLKGLYHKEHDLHIALEKAEEAVIEAPKRLAALEAQKEKDSGYLDVNDIKDAKEAIQGTKDKVAEIKEKIKKIEKEIESAEKDCDPKDSEKIKKYAELEHKLHHEEHALKDQFDKHFEKGFEAEIKRKKEEIKYLRQADKEKVNDSKSFMKYKDFLYEQSENDDEEFRQLLEESYYTEHSTLRESRVQNEFNSFVTNDLEIEMDEEFEKMKSGYDDLSEDEINEWYASLKAKLMKLFTQVEKQYSDFDNGILAKWKEWTWDEDMPKEVEAAAQTLRVPFEDIQYFSNESNPDAFNYFMENLPEVTKKYKEGEYKQKYRSIKFVVVVNE